MLADILFDIVWVADILFVPAIMPLVFPILVFGDAISVESLGLLLLQPTNTNAARTGIDSGGIAIFIRLFFIGLLSLFSFLFFKFTPNWSCRENKPYKQKSFVF